MGKTESFMTNASGENLEAFLFAKLSTDSRLI